MGGGSEYEVAEVGDYEEVAAFVFQVCDSVAYGITAGERQAVSSNWRDCELET